MAFTPISEIGEFGLVDRITQGFPSLYEHTVKGIGDDAAVIRTGKDEVQVFATDMLLEGVHFDLAYSPLRHLGYKSVVVNISDVLAMNALPYGITVSIGISNRFTIEAIDELYAGIKLACEKYHIELLGGDTTSSQQGLVISVTAFGKGKEQDIIYRSGAKPKDLICVTGDLGAAYAGFLVLDREKSSFIDQPELQPDLTDYDYVIGRQLKPELPGPVLSSLLESEIRPNAMMDISDGLASELHHICKESKKGATIYAHKLPIDFQTVKVAEEFEISPTTFAMNGGEDYELLMTLPLAAYEKIVNIPELTIIGHITEEAEQVQIILDTGAVADVEAQGWNHFDEKEESN